VDADLLVSYVAALYPINPCIIHFIAWLIEYHLVNFFYIWWHPWVEYFFTACTIILSTFIMVT